MERRLECATSALIYRDEVAGGRSSLRVVEHLVELTVRSDVETS
jgi:hypothetical protein